MGRQRTSTPTTAARAFKMAADEAKSKKRSGEEETEDVDSKRQKAAAAEGEDVAEDDEPEAPKESKAKNEAIAYLASFGFDGWKFKKVRQTWLLQHIYDGAKLEDRHFPQLLLYLAGLKGVSRTKTLEEAQAIVKECEENEVEDHRQARALKVVGELDE